MNYFNTPKRIDHTVIKFCKSISPHSKPEYIQLRPELWCRPNDCYNNVEQKVAKYGGKRQLGWRIQVIPDPNPKFMIEAVHHAIWITATGQKIDITPQPNVVGKIVFVSDDITKLENHRVGEKYQALLDCPIVHEYVGLCNLESEHYTSKTKLIKQPKPPVELLMKQEQLKDLIFRKHGRL